jgi:methionyl-tRNA synthetase
MLHALGLEQPKQIFGHPWLLFDNDKMSKSRGNVAYADDLVKEYGVDAVRFYVLHEMPFASDGNFSIDLLEGSINSNLANTLGNLVNRTVGMLNKYNDGVVENKEVTEPVDDDLKETCLKTKKEVFEKMESLRVADALDAIFRLYSRTNKYIDETTPWILAKDENSKDRLNTVLYDLIESIRYGTVLLQAFLPDTSEEIFRQINSNDKDFSTLDKFGYFKTGTKVNDAKVLFQRIEKK